MTKEKNRNQMAAE